MNFILEIFGFLVFVVFGLYAPGVYILNKLKLNASFPANIFLPTSFGIILFTSFIYLFSWVHLEILLIPVLIIIGALSIKENMLIPKINKVHLKPSLLVLFLTLLFSTSALITGIYGNSIIIKQDDFWHLALINELKVNFPPDNPGFAGVALKGYHFFYNLLLAKVSNLFFVSPASLHFHFFPVLFSLAWGFGVYSLVFRWTRKISASLIAVFLTLFGGGFAYFLTLQGHSGFSWSAGYGMNQPFGALQNPPLSISIVILLVILLCLYEYIESKNNKWLIPLSLSLGIISMFKVYAGMVGVLGFTLFSFWELIHKRIYPFFALIFTGIIFLATYWIFAGGSGYLIFYPLWPFHRILEAFSWYGFDEKLATYTRLNVLRGILGLEFDGFNVFILGNLGTRLIGLLILPIIFIKQRKLPSVFANTIFIMLLISVVIPLLFIQSGKVFEIIQITNYYIFIAAILAAYGFGYLIDLKINKLIKIFFIVLVFILTIPSTLEGVLGYPITLSAKNSLNSPYYQALNFLSKQGNYNSTVLELPPIESGSKFNDLKGWYEKSNPAVTALANRKTFFNSEYINFPGLDLEPRINLLMDLGHLRTVSASTSAFPYYEKMVISNLRKNKVDYIFSKELVPNFDKTKYLKKIYSNSTYVIYQVEK